MSLRPHVTAAKCIVVAQRQPAAGSRGVTVSTLKGAEQLFAGGFDDILYAVCIAPPELAAHDALPALRQASLCVWFANRPFPRGGEPRHRAVPANGSLPGQSVGLQAARWVAAGASRRGDYSARAITSFMISLVPP